MMPATTSAADLRATMRMLWEDHITYTRNYIISALADLPDINAVASRLLRNQDDIGDAIGSYHGAEAGKKLAALLRDHILIATEVVKAAKADSKDELTAAQKKWSSNGKDIAAFLGAANPHWPRREMEQMLQKHLDLTTGEAVGRLTKDWAADIRSYDRGHQHMLMLLTCCRRGSPSNFPARSPKKIGRQVPCRSSKSRRNTMLQHVHASSGGGVVTLICTAATIARS
jgi:hypothetical protein